MRELSQMNGHLGQICVARPKLHYTEVDAGIGQAIRRPPTGCDATRRRHTLLRHRADLKTSFVIYIVLRSVSFAYSPSMCCHVWSSSRQTYRVRRAFDRLGGI